MLKNASALALCFTQAISAVYAQEATSHVPTERRNATAEELEICAKSPGFHVIDVTKPDGAPRFTVLTCALGQVTEDYNCQSLFLLASVSDDVARIQGGYLNPKQKTLADSMYKQVRIPYDNNCNFIS